MASHNYNFRPGKKLDYPRTFFLLLKDKNLYLLFWLEYGKDNSMYLWFDDNPSNSWGVKARFSQTDKINGSKNITFVEDNFDVIDPHISWHSSGRIHVSGYSKQGKKGEKLISDKNSPSWNDVEKNRLTVPFSQMVFPVGYEKESLVWLDKGVKDIFDNNSFVGFLGKGGFTVQNDHARGPAYIIIDSNIIPKNKFLAIDLQLYDKNFAPDFSFCTMQSLIDDLIFPNSINLFKEKTDISVACRFFTVSQTVKESKIPVVATCFNKDSVELFQLNKLGSIGRSGEIID